MEREVAVQAVRRAGGVDGFVGAGGVVAVGVLEPAERGQVDGVGARPVEGHVGVVMNGQRQGGEEDLGGCVARVVWQYGDLRCVEALDLGGVENAVGPGDGGVAAGVAVLVGVAVLAAGGVGAALLPEDDGGGLRPLRPLNRPADALAWLL